MLFALRKAVLLQFCATLCKMGKSSWSNIKKLNAAISSGLLDDLPDRNLMLKALFKNPAALAFMATSPISFRIISNRDMLLRLSQGRQWNELFGDLNLLKTAYAEAEKILDEEEAKLGKSR